MKFLGVRVYHQPEKIVKITESENRGLWSSCVVASVFKRIKSLQSALR